MRRIIVMVALGAVILAAGGSANAAADGPLSKVSVSGDAGSKPIVKLAAGFKVAKSVSTELTKGTGSPIGKGAKVTFDYVLVDGRTAKEVDSSYAAQPATASLDPTQLPASIVRSIVGTSVGSRVLLALAPKEGTAKQLVATGKVKKDDTLVFVIDVVALRNPLARATGDAVTPPPGLPSVKLDASTGKPTITMPGGAAPTSLVAQTLVKGAGPAVTQGQTITAHYSGLIFATGKQFDSSWDRGQPADFQIGAGKVIKGWDQGLVGQTVGSQVLLVVPPDLGYGSQGQPSAGIGGTDTLVFVVDILDAY